MTAPHASDIINGYLARLEAETASLPGRERRELIDGVREHIAAARSEMPDESDAALLNLLDRLGDPAELADEEWERLGIDEEPAPRAGVLEIAALILTPLIWPIGVILLWTSSAWSVRDKLIGTLLPPGGLFTSLVIFSIATLEPVMSCPAENVHGHYVSRCSGGITGIRGVLLVILLVIVLFSPILTGIYMGIRVRRRPHVRTTEAQFGY